MQGYLHILVALDIFGDYTPVLDRALAIAGDAAKLSLIYGVELPFQADVYESTMLLQAQEDHRAEALAKLRQIGAECNVPGERQIIESGRTSTLVHRYAKQQAVDLIVIGSHGRRGVQLLLGSTANAVLHGATCDVLAVHVGKKH